MLSIFYKTIVIKPLEQIKIGTLNLCLGLLAKKELVKQTILCEEIELNKY